MSKVTENVKKVLDTDKLKKNGIDLLGFVLGIAGGVVLSNVVKGKLPMANIMEPLTTVVPGVSGAILLEDPFWKSASKGFASVGAIDGLNKAVNAIPFLSFAAPYVPKVSNSKTVAGLGRMGELNLRNSALLGGMTGGSRYPIPAYMM